MHRATSGYDASVAAIGRAGRWREAGGVRARPAPRVHPAIVRTAAYSWRILVIAALAVAVLWLIGQLRIVVFPVIVALFLTRALHPIARRIRGRRFGAGLAAVTTLLGFLLVLAGISTIIIPVIADQFADLGPTVTEAVDDVETWLLEDSPFDVSQQDLQDVREQARSRLSEWVRSSGGAVVSGATVIVEGLTGTLLALLLTFFMLKDGDRFVRWAERWAPAPQRPRVHRASKRAWRTVGAYLRGAALLGVVEGTIIGLTLALTGSGLAIPVGIITFAGAFVPILGAIVAAIIAVLVALVTGGFTAAVIVAIVALVVQQLDNDVLSPVIYGRQLSLHPVVILLSLVAGGALFGIAGTILAVPVTAVIINVVSELRRDDHHEQPADNVADDPHEDPVATT